MVPFESVTRAVSWKIPAAVGVHEVVYGATSAAPMLVVPPTKKSTRLMVAPPVPAAVAVTVGLVPSGIAVPCTGPVMATVGIAEATTILTAEEVMTLLFESVTRAVREKVPVDVGVQSNV